MLRHYSESRPHTPVVQLTLLCIQPSLLWKASICQMPNSSRVAKGPQSWQELRCFLLSELKLVMIVELACVKDIYLWSRITFLEIYYGIFCLIINYNYYFNLFINSNIYMCGQSRQ